MEATERQDLYSAICAYGLLSDLRDKISKVRADRKYPSRDTVHRAFNLPSENLTGNHKLIITVAKKLLDEHRAAVGINY